MSDFSEHLMRIKASRQFVMSRLSDAIGVERTTLHNFFNGRRLPQNEDFIDRLALELRLSISEINMLKHEFALEKIGVKNAGRYKSIETILKECAATSDEELWACHSSPALLMPPPNIPDGLILKKKNEVLKFITIAIDCSVRSRGKADIIAPPSENIRGVLLGVTSRGAKSSVRHMFCFNSADSSSYDTYNLEAFRNVLTVYSELQEYAPAFYYGGVSDFSNMLLVYPYCVITDDYVIVFDDTYESAVVYKNKSVISSYSRLFSEKYNKCTGVFQKRRELSIFLTSISRTVPTK